MWDTPTSPGIRLRRIALATLSWLSPIRRPRLRQTLIGAIRLGGRPYGAGTPKSEHLPSFDLPINFSVPATKESRGWG